MGFSSCAKSEEARRNVKIERVVRIYVVEIFAKGGAMLQAGEKRKFSYARKQFRPICCVAGFSRGSPARLFLIVEFVFFFFFVSLLSA